MWKRLYFSPSAASRSAVGVLHGPPNALDAANPTSSSSMTRTLGAPAGGLSGSIGGNAGLRVLRVEWESPLECLVGNGQGLAGALVGHVGNLLQTLDRCRTQIVRNGCEAVVMNTAADVSVSWSQALAWRLERHLLDPVGSESVAEVVRRLGAVLSMDESLAELAVRTRRTTSRAGRTRAGAGGRGGDQGLRVPRGGALPLARGGRCLPRAPIGGAAVGAAELGGALPADRLGLAGLQGGRARGAAGRAVDDRRSSGSRW